jgi:hypothetical protein
MMSHEECVAYIKDNELGFELGNYYGSLVLKHENGVYIWSVEDDDGIGFRSQVQNMGDYV